MPPIAPQLTFQNNVPGEAGTLLLSHPVSIGAERARIDVLFSSDLTSWNDGTADLQLVSAEPLGDGRALLTWRVNSNLQDQGQVFVRLRATER